MKCPEPIARNTTKTAVNTVGAADSEQCLVTEEYNSMSVDITKLIYN